MSKAALLFFAFGKEEKVSFWWPQPLLLPPLYCFSTRCKMLWEFGRFQLGVLSANVFVAVSTDLENFRSSQLQWLGAKISKHYQALKKIIPPKKIVRAKDITCSLSSYILLNIAQLLCCIFSWLTCCENCFYLPL